MVKLKNEQLKEGMILARDVKDRSGRTLLREGMTLSEKSIKTLKTWGVIAVEIQSDDAEVDSAMHGEIENLIGDEEFQNQIEEDINRQFAAQENNHPVIQDLYQVIYDYNLRKAAEKIIKDRYGNALDS